MIVLRTPKGWTGPKEVDGKQVVGTTRSHQVPMGEMSAHPDHVRILEDWMKSYRPEELFDATGRLNSEFAELAPRGTRRMGANPHANGGELLQDLRLPDFHDYAVDVVQPGAIFSVLATNTLDAGCMASPAAVGTSLIVRTKTHLYRIE